MLYTYPGIAISKVTAGSTNLMSKYTHFSTLPNISEKLAVSQLGDVERMTFRAGDNSPTKFHTHSKCVVFCRPL